ncbi:GDP-mannose 6-dehydrogenase [subsurface metagenome]|jgi:UDPglucose 6-dehydrogenase
MKLSVIGLGKLGLPMAGVFASKGYDVIGLDINKEIVEQIQQGHCPVQETGLEQLLASLNPKLQVTTNYNEATNNTDITFIIVPTPSDKTGKFSNEYVLSAIRNIAPILKEKKEYHLVVVTSTIMPGTMDKVIKPELEELTGLECVRDFGLCYNPEFVALGSVIKGMTNPDAILIGESDHHSGLTLEKFYEDICDNNPPVVKMSWWNAELAKLALNVFITTKVSLANTFAEVCSKMPTGNINDVTKFLGLDSRIGHKYLEGGLGFGGPCFPRDNRAFIEFAKGLGVKCPLQKATSKFNDGHNNTIITEAIKLLEVNDFQLVSNGLINKTVSILGITYKPGTNVTEESSALKVAQTLAGFGAEVKVYDPAGKGSDGLTDTPNIGKCLQDSDLCIVAVPWQEFKGLGPNSFKVMRQPKVLDCWRILNSKAFINSGMKYYALGVNNG